MNWYIVQAYSGFEKKVVENIKEELKKNKVESNLEELMAVSYTHLTLPTTDLV